MLMKTLMRNRACFNLISRPLMMQPQIRGFAIQKYHFDDSDYIPTTEQVSSYIFLICLVVTENPRI